MSEKIQETQERLKKLGYFASEDLAKIILLFEAAGKKGKKSIPTLLLQGKSGAGKTFLAETFSQMIGADEKFVQCFPRMGTENFQYDVNIEGVMKQDADSSIKAGILLQALQQSQKGPVVLVIDELDKARPEVDSFLLDFLENGRLTTGTDTYEKGQYPIYTFVTSNDKRISQRFITGKILHLDGDRKYSEKSYQYYRKLGLDAVVKNIPEYKQSKVVYELLNKYNPDILVITGHDGMIKRGTNYNDIYNYRNSRHFINTVKEARRYDLEKGKKTVIFAGACQSYFEAIITAGANFASSPARILIDFLDPLIVAEKVATTSEYKYINIEDIVKELRDGKKGVGGVGSNGRMKYIVI